MSELTDYVIMPGSDYQNICDSVRAKTGGTNILKSGEISAAIDGIQAGRGGIERKDVNFYDYDGTLLHSYTVEEAANLTGLPNLPSHNGLICQGWNYNLETIKKYNKPLNIGAMYITDDGKTRLYINIDSELLLDVSICYGFAGDTTIGVTIDWGDGSIETVTDVGILTVSHTYESIGDYIISLDSSETITLGSNTYSIMTALPSNRNKLKKVEIGKKITNIIANAFESCYSLSSITIPNNVITIGDNAFTSCYSLSNVNIPDGVTTIGDNAFSGGYSLSNVSIPNGVTIIGNNMFSHCFSLSNVNIPDRVTIIGERAFSHCYSLSNVNIPDGVTTIGDYVFENCCSLSSMTIPNNVDIQIHMFMHCHKLSSVIIPDGVTTIGGYAFYNCYSLSNVNIPDGVTTIGGYAFYNCYSLSSITIPNSVITIGDSSFYRCINMKIYDFSTHTSVPSLGSNTFVSIHSDCEIRVPAALYDAWVATTNWKNYASNIVAV